MAGSGGEEISVVVHGVTRGKKNLNSDEEGIRYLMNCETSTLVRYFDASPHLQTYNVVSLCLYSCPGVYLKMVVELAAGVELAGRREPPRLAWWSGTP